jgi:hypothetical protein
MKPNGRKDGGLTCHCCMCYQPSLFLSAALEYFLMADTITANMSANRMARSLEGKM